jgi:hypothetical protein
MSEPTSTPPEPVTERPDTTARPLIVLDLGTKRRKQIKRLRKGEGGLMQSINDTLTELKADAAIDPQSQIVVVVVKQKSKSKGLW